MTTVNRQQEFVLEECIDCGCNYMVTSQFQAQRMIDKKTFHCPNGHPQSYIKSTNETLREKLASSEKLVNDQKATIEARGRYISSLNAQIDKLEKKLERKSKKAATLKGNQS